MAEEMRIFTCAMESLSEFSAVSAAIRKRKS